METIIKMSIDTKTVENDGVISSKLLDNTKRTMGMIMRSSLQERSLLFLNTL